MARKYETEYQVSKTAEVLKSENDFRRSVDLRLDALEQGLAGLGSDADVLVARVVRAIETEISPRAAEIEALLADYREGVPAALVAEEAGGRQFLTPERRAAILAELRGDVDLSGDTLAKLLTLIGAVDAAKATPADITAAINALKGSAPAIYDTLAEIAAWIATSETAEAAIMTALAEKANASDVTTALAGKQAALGYTPANKAGDTFTGNVRFSAGEIHVYGWGGNAATGVVRLSQDGAAYLYWDGTNYSLGGVGKGIIWHEGNFNPANYQPVPTSGAPFWAVGTVALFKNKSGAVIAGGSSVPGSSLGYSLFNASGAADSDGTSPTGTWKCFTGNIAVNYHGFFVRTA